jgi:16S rRNA (guanine966-N2)-methyltransferase
MHRRDAATALRDAAVRGDAYDLVFLDPPYRPTAGLAAQLREALPAVLAPGARVVAESDRRAPLALGLAVNDERRYGNTLIRIHDT